MVLLSSGFFQQRVETRSTGGAELRSLAFKPSTAFIHVQNRTSRLFTFDANTANSTKEVEVNLQLWLDS